MGLAVAAGRVRPSSHRGRPVGGRSVVSTARTCVLEDDRRCLLASVLKCSVESKARCDECLGAGEEDAPQAARESRQSASGCTRESTRWNAPGGRSKARHRSPRSTNARTRRSLHARPRHFRPPPSRPSPPRPRQWLDGYLRMTLHLHIVATVLEAPGARGPPLSPQCPCPAVLPLCRSFWCAHASCSPVRYRCREVLASPFGVVILGRICRSRCPTPNSHHVVDMAF